jgi:hypothetical protein
MASISYENAIPYLLQRFPDFEDASGNDISFQPEVLPHPVMGLFTRLVETRLAASKDDPWLRRAFDTLEDLATSDDPRTENLVEVSFCENLGKSDYRLVETAIPLMGPRTLQLLERIEAFWGGRLKGPD